VAWVAVVLTVGLACNLAAPPRTVRGVVLSVEATTPARATAITLRADNGEEYRLLVAPGVNMTPGHLREHMALGEPVVVELTRGADGLVAVRIDDG
jgi:hypothetical protein